MSFKAVTAALNQADKDRLLAAHINTETPKINWNKAAADYGSASVNSFRTMYSEAKRKIDKAMQAGVDKSEPVATSKPSSSSKSSKRKRTTEDDDEEETAQSTKKDGKGSKKSTKAPKNEPEPPSAEKKSRKSPPVKVKAEEAE